MFFKVEEEEQENKNNRASYENCTVQVPLWCDFVLSYDVYLWFIVWNIFLFELNQQKTINK